MHDGRKEAEIENDIIDLLTACKVFHWKVKTVGTYDPKRQCFRKTHRRYRKGVWDIHGFHRGCPFIIEVKSATGRLSVEQLAFQQDWLAATEKIWGMSMVARSVDDVVEQFTKAGIALPVR